MSQFRFDFMSRNNDPTTKYLCSYYHDGAEWSCIIHAYDWEDAEARVKKLGFLRLEGQFMGRYSANFGWWVKISCWFKNLIRNQR